MSWPMRSTSISSTSRKALYAVRDYLEGTDDKNVVIVGPSARTWYVDQYLLRYVLVALSGVSPTIVSGGKFPFDMHVEEACEKYDIHWVPAYTKSAKKRLTKDYIRPAATWLDCDLLIVFPHGDELDSADPMVECVCTPKLIVPRELDWSVEWE